MMRRIFTLLLFFTLCISAVPTVVDAPQVLTFAQQCLPHQGVLAKTEIGFVYVKVSDDYIYETVKLLGEGNVKNPPYFGPGLVGAHITVMDAVETRGKKLDLPQLGKPIAFTIVNFSRVDVMNESGTRRIYFFTVDAPELAKIREANGLPPQVRGLDFHITAATQYLETPSDLKIEPSP